MDEGRRGKKAGSQVAIGLKFLAQFEDALFGADGAGAPFLQS